eukprot:3360536-Prymnesium_polylepis.2
MNRPYPTDLAENVGWFERVPPPVQSPSAASLMHNIGVALHTRTQTAPPGGGRFRPPCWRIASVWWCLATSCGTRKASRSSSAHEGGSADAPRGRKRSNASRSCCVRTP